MIFNKNFLCISYVSRAISVLLAYVVVDLTRDVEMFNNVHVGIVLRPYVLRLFVLTPFTRMISVRPLLTPYF
jgi:hypothetical protein